MMEPGEWDKHVKYHIGKKPVAPPFPTESKWTVHTPLNRIRVHLRGRLIVSVGPPGWEFRGRTFEELTRWAQAKCGLHQSLRIEMEKLNER